MMAEPQPALAEMAGNIDGDANLEAKLGAHKAKRAVTSSFPQPLLSMFYVFNLQSIEILETTGS